LHVVGKPDQRVVGGDIGDDGAQRRDRLFELLHRAGIVIGAQDGVKLGAEIANRLVVAGKLLGGLQRAQYVADFVERVLDVGKHRAVDAALAVVLDPARQRADFAFDGLDRAARHRLGDGDADFGQLAAERRDRLLDVGALQRFDLARDLEQMPFQRREIRAWRRRRRGRGHHGRGRRRLRLALRHRARRRGVELVLARGDFGDRKVHRGRAQRRRLAIGGRGLGLRRVNLACGALDGCGLALLPVLVLALGLWTGNLRQPGIEPRDGVVELAGDALLAPGFAARHRLRDALDLPGDGIKSLVDVGDVAAGRSGGGRVAEIGWRGVAEAGIEPVAERHPGSVRGGFGPLADGWIDAVDTPRLARIH